MNQDMLLTHVLLDECGLRMGDADLIEATADGEGITQAEGVPMIRTYAAGSLVHEGLAGRLVAAGYSEVVIELGRPVVAVALQDSDEVDARIAEAMVVFLPTVEPEIDL